jgi:hypothetical protein
VVIDFPVTVCGQKPDGSIFEETARTLTVNSHGALIRINSNIDTHKPAMLTNPKTRIEAECRVVFRKELGSNGCEIALEFADPSPRFWGINFPPEDWDPAERKRPDTQKAPPRSTKG